MKPTFGIFNDKNFLYDSLSSVFGLGKLSNLILDDDFIPNRAIINSINKDCYIYVESKGKTLKYIFETSNLFIDNKKLGEIKDGEYIISIKENFPFVVGITFKHNDTPLSFNQENHQVLSSFEGGFNLESILYFIKTYKDIQLISLGGNLNLQINNYNSEPGYIGFTHWDNF